MPKGFCSPESCVYFMSYCSKKLNIQLFDDCCCYSSASDRQAESLLSILMEKGIYLCCLCSPGGFRMPQFERKHTEGCVTETVARSQVIYSMFISFRHHQIRWLLMPHLL